MVRPFLALTSVVVLLGSLWAADDKEKKDREGVRPTNVTVTKVDAKKNEITVKLTDEQGKTREKTFHLSEEVLLRDETGRAVKLDVFESGNEVVLIESEGKLKEVRRSPLRSRIQGPADTVRTLIEMSDGDPTVMAEVQQIYDMLRKLDTNKDGKLDPKALKTEAENILQERVKEVFNRLDTNKDGKISREEARGRIKEDFDRIDTNKDGFIEFDELLKAARERVHSKAADVKPEPKPAEKEKK